MHCFLPILCLLFATQNRSDDIRSVVVQAFAASHSGFSSDEVLLDDQLNRAFVKECQKHLPEESVEKFNWTLINLRKAGKLSHIKTTRRKRASTKDYSVIAEIVARSMLDKNSVSIDRLFANPLTRTEFDQKAKKINPEVDLYLVRKAAFQLRKARKLKPELITRIADWGREISDFPINKIKEDPNLIPKQPGIYIFHNESGYLYIGQSENLRTRLSEHFDKSSNLELANYLDNSKLNESFVEIHAFPSDSRAKDVIVRRAYESELIRSRKPKFNILP